MGNVVWLAYNGALLSQLITPKVVKPFHDWESLIKSGYKLYVGSGPTGATASIFINAEQNTVYGRVYKNNMDNSSFESKELSIMNTIKHPKAAIISHLIDNTSPCRVINSPLDSFYSLHLGSFNNYVDMKGWVGG